MTPRPEYVCQVCGRTFAVPSLARWHEETHLSDEAPPPE